MSIDRVKYLIGSVTVSMLVSIAADSGFERRSGQTKDYEIGNYCFSAKHETLGRKSLECPSGATCLSMDRF